jgi:ELWxxDGT repeat protein
MNMKNKIYFILIAFFYAINLLAQNTYIVKDVSPAVLPNMGSDPDHLTNVNGILFFNIYDNLYGTELWKSDGTDAGTVMVKDINVGGGSSYPSSLTSANGVLFFLVDNGNHVKELWTSDGTAVGTTGLQNADAGTISNLTTVGNLLYFSMGGQLWKSDGTKLGTTQVYNFNISIGNLVNVNGILFFTVYSNNLIGLWKSDGTIAGTVFIKTIESEIPNNGITELTNINGILYFYTHHKVILDVDIPSGFITVHIWKSDGTPNGTIKVKDFGSTNIQKNGNELIGEFTNLNGILFFTSNDGFHGNELWKSDGTEVGTVEVGNFSATNNLTNVNGILYFVANDGSYGNELWKSDGTTAGTVIVKDINIGAGSSGLEYLFNFNGVLYFTLYNSANVSVLWKSDGTATGTILVKDINVGNDSSQYHDPLFTNVNGVLFFIGDDGIHGKELWKSHTTKGAVLVKDLNNLIDRPNPINLTNVNGLLYFLNDDGIVGNELWKSDGTAAGTVLVKDITVGAGSSLLFNLTNVNDILYFTTNDGTNGIELWKSNGTTAGTILVKDINIGPADSSPSNLTNVNGVLYFTANKTEFGIELWKSDGTDAGTVMLKDIYVGANSGSPLNLCNVNGLLYFTTKNIINGNKLWKSDGTTVGTVLVKEIEPSINSAYSFPSNLTNLNGVLYFTTNSLYSGVTNNKFWRSDGTDAGTTVVNNLGMGNLTNVNGILYFDSDGLWKSDGTATGTTLVKNIRIDSKLINVNGIVYFSSYNDLIGEELWKSDGTTAGTVLVKDIYVGRESSIRLSKMINFNGVLYFTANDGVNGIELWKSDGTSAGTVLVKDLFTGPSSANPAYLTDVSNGTSHQLFFSATHNTPNTIGNISLWALGNCGSINTIANTNTTNFNQEKQTSPTTLNCNCDVFNNLIASVNAIGTSPFTGNINSKVWIEPTQPATYVQRHYEITPENNSTTATGKVTLYFTQAEFDAYNAINTSKLPTMATDFSGKSNVRIDKFAGTSVDGTGLPNTYAGEIATTIDPADSDIIFNITAQRWEISFDVTGFSGFFLTTATAAPLPITLLYFSGKKVNQTNVLNWATSQEINASHFEIERSIDGLKFEKIGKVNANFITKENTKYDFVNYQTGSRIEGSFYRLKLLDLDGKFTYSKVIYIANDTDSHIVGDFYPNPVVDNFSNIDIIATENEDWTIKILDVFGKVIGSEKRNLKKGYNKIMISGSVKGLNIISFENGRIFETRKFIN